MTNNTIQAARDGKFHVIQIYTREELIHKFYEMRDSVMQLDAQLLEAKKAMENIEANIKHMEEAKIELSNFLQQAGEVIDTSNQK